MYQSYVGRTTNGHAVAVHVPMNGLGVSSMKKEAGCECATECALTNGHEQHARVLIALALASSQLLLPLPQLVLVLVLPPPSLMMRMCYYCHWQC